ncbi:hypothetical protein GOP47_0017193 [Adiantum capillus-veneris]|uniref:Uncharacterized protein n=1 Tax=Adiantum capillus-veneris TaxID=13818 RepID=A0A9D4UJ37_ADICA|nr:hypothetical protein GOP47_0017193 [Adiantum capillus-veneris]
MHFCNRPNWRLLAERALFTRKLADETKWCTYTRAGTSGDPACNSQQHVPPELVLPQPTCIHLLYGLRVLLLFLGFFSYRSGLFNQLLLPCFAFSQCVYMWM